MDTSSFSEIQHTFPDAELLPVEGSTCDCYRVRLYGKLHFLKQLKPELRTDPRYVAALQKEFETGYGLDHPHLARYVSHGEDYLMTEYVDGETLSQFVVSHPDYFKSKKNTNRFLSQLLDVLGYLHAHQVVHLDLKPDNILITRIGNDVKLTDLGYCYTDTYTDTMGRTDKYAAPEQFPSLGKEGSGVVANPDARTDIYAVGKILETLPCPAIYNKVTARCTKPNKEERYQSAEEIKNHLPNDSISKVWWLAILLFIVVLAVVWLYPSPQPILGNGEKEIADSAINKSPINDSTYKKAKPVVAPIKKEPDTEELLMADVRQVVETNISVVLDAHQDSIRRSSDPNYSAGTYLKALNISSAKQLSAKYPQISKNHIAKAVDDYTTYLIDKMSKD